MQETMQEDSMPETVPVRVQRVCDSCCDRDCFEALPLQLSIGELPARVTRLQAEKISVAAVSVCTEEIPFHSGFFVVQLRFSFSVLLAASGEAGEQPVLYPATAACEKRCVLFGSALSSRSFTCDGTGCENAVCGGALPLVTVQTAEPVVLQTAFCTVDGHRGATATIGLFSVVELSRPMTVLLPTYPYTVPKRQETGAQEDPCTLFRNLPFPEAAFSPLSLEQT